MTNHPYTFVDPVNFALVSTNITPVTAQYFRAEFTQYTAGRGYDGPRVIELDGFGTRPPVCDPPPSGLVSWWAAEGKAQMIRLERTTALWWAGRALLPEKSARHSVSTEPASMWMCPNKSTSLNPTNGVTLEAWINPKVVVGQRSAELRHPGSSRRRVKAWSSRTVTRVEMVVAAPNPWAATRLFLGHMSAAGWVGAFRPTRWCRRISGRMWQGCMTEPTCRCTLMACLREWPMPAPGTIVPSGNDLQIGHDPSNPRDISAD